MSPFQKKLFFLLIIFFLTSSEVFAQSSPPSIQWQKSYGGSFDDYPQCIEQTSDKGFIIAGASNSNDSNVAGHHGTTDFADYWIVKLDSNGDLDWQRSLGGSGNDVANSIKQTPDGGYIVAGFSDSKEGDVPRNHGMEDYWIVKLNNNGTIGWQTSYGGSNNDEAYSIDLTSDGGYIVAGFSYSNDKDVTGHHGSTDSADYWIIKLDRFGNVQWGKSFGGTGEDQGYSIRQTNDHGYIIAGTSTSNNNDVSGNHGNEDDWIVKLDSIGNILWQKTFGGKDVDVAFSLDLTSDGGYVVAGYSISNDGEVSGNHGDADYWVLKLDSMGDMEWEKTFGGGDVDAAYSVKQTSDGGYIVAGGTASNDGEVSRNHGDNDFWIIKLDNTGNLLWQKTLGGSDGEYALCIRETIDTGYIIAGFAYSRDGDLTNFEGAEDYWIVKLKTSSQNGVTIPKNSAPSLTANYPNPFTDKTTIVLSQNTTFGSSLLLYNPLGQEVRRIEIPEGISKIILDRDGLPDGVYIYRLMSGSNVIAKGNIIIE